MKQWERVLPWRAQPAKDTHQKAVAAWTKAQEAFLTATPTQKVETVLGYNGRMEAVTIKD